MRTLFWVSALVVAYVYVGYPLLLAAWARVAARADRGRKFDAPTLPYVSVIIAARNEAHHLGARLENLLAQDYPAERLEIVVVSDGSTDDSERVVRRLSPRVRYLAVPAGGKALALNAGVRDARHPVLVFADARQRFAPDALRRLVAPLADPRVGGVSGELHFDEGGRRRAEGGNDGVGEGVGLYWAYETWIRRKESEVASVIGATGAIYALRKAAWRDLPAETILDDVLTPMRAVLGGYRVVFEPLAQAFDVVPEDAEVERRRKTRTLAGNYQLLRLEPRLLVPGVNPVWLQFASHKLGRLAVPYALIGLIVSNAALASASLFYSLALILQVSFYVLALHGATLALTPAPPPPARPPRVAGAGPRVAPARLETEVPGRSKEWMNASLD